MANKATPCQPTKRRNRIPLSCESCRTRKLKCDRQKPCQNCTARGLQSSCTFAGNSNIRFKHGAPVPSPQSEDMRARLQRLEALVSTMAQGSTPPPPPPSMHTPESSPDFRLGALSPSDSDMRSTVYSAKDSNLIQHNNGQRFIGPSHWEAVLQDLAALKEHFEDTPEPQFLPVPQTRNPALLSGISSELTVTDLYEALPSKDFSDRMISRFFDTYDPAVPSRQILHKPTFMRDYATFWTKLDQVDLSLMGILFSVYCLALQSYDRQDDEPSDLRDQTLELSETYRKRSAQCLLKSNIATPSRRHLEAFLLYGISEYARVGDESVVSQWFILGMMVRKAFHMGFHRDPDEFSSLSPFEKEMRRRLWAHVWQIDTLYSFSLGLPSSVGKSVSNAASPRNLFEEELSEDMKEIPQAHPAEVMTPISFTIAKLNILHGLASVVNHFSSLEEHTYTQVMGINRQLLSAYDEIPSFLRIKPWEESVADPKPLRLQRLQLRMFYDKAICTLNRRFLDSKLPPEHTNGALNPRQLCIEAAMSLLRIQVGYHRERNKWFRFHLSRHDFLLAAVILFLALGTKYWSQDRSLGQSGNLNSYDEEDQEIFRALFKAREIWSEHTSASRDAQTACRMFDRMRDRFQLPTADAQMGISMHPVASQFREPDIGCFSSHIETAHGIVTPGVEAFNVGARQFTDFDWNAWETAFGDGGMEQALDNPMLFWTSAPGNG